MKKSIHVLLKIGITFFILGVLVFLILFVSLIIKEGSVAKTTFPPDAIIVLGAQVKQDGTLSVQLSDRLEAALNAHLRYPDAYLVTCGGQGADEPAPEADVMKAWLVKNGVPQERIFTDPHSVNTKENIENAIFLMESHSLKVKQVYVVTSDYHLPRSLALAEDLGLEAQGIASVTKPEYWIKNHLRETLSWGKYYLQKYIGWPK